MRRCFTLLMLLAAFATSGCDDKTTEEIADVIVLSRSSVAFAVEGGTTTVSVASPSAWEASCPDSWVKLQPEEGFLTISADGNPNDLVRESEVTLTTSGDEKRITVRQAFSLDKVILQTTASEQIEFDSEGESFLFSVISNGSWDVTSDADWITLTSDPVTGIVRVEASRNTGEHRTAKLNVVATKGSQETGSEVILSQISREENTYYRLLGYYGLHAENWYFGNDPIGVSGTATFCTIEEKEYRKSFYIKDLFLKGTVVEASYDKLTETMQINLGRLCQTVEITSTLNRFHYFVSLNVENRSFGPGLLTGTLGEGYNDVAEETRKAILLTGLTETYPSLGIVALQKENYMFFSDLYYTEGPVYLVDWSNNPASTAVTQVPVPADAAGKTYPITKN